MYHALAAFLVPPVPPGFSLIDHFRVAKNVSAQFLAARRCVFFPAR